MSPRKKLFLVIVLVLIASPRSSAAQKSPVNIFKSLRPSVVLLANPEGHGTGFLISEDGLILTNAHVVASPLPFTCTIESVDKGKVKSYLFKQVSVLGFHPVRDLALAKIDPSEHPIKLNKATWANKKSTPGQRVYAIGNPSSGNRVLDKTITSGLISGVDRIIDNVKYYQIDAAVNPGNSGGPLVDDFGKVVGVVTLKSHSNENVGFATPFYDLTHKDFIPVTEVKPNPEATDYFLKRAEEYLEKAANEEKSLREYFGQSYYQMMAAHHFHQAIKFDPLNPGIYFQCGESLRKAGRFAIAESYLRFSVQLSPYKYDNAKVYRSLGLALARQEKIHDAYSVWREGIRKYPKKCAKCYEDIAVTEFNAEKYVEARAYAKIALGFGSTRTKSSLLRTIIDLSEKKLTAEELESSDELVAQTDELLKQWLIDDQEIKDEERPEARTNGFKTYMKSQGRFLRQKEIKIPEFDFSKAGS